MARDEYPLNVPISSTALRTLGEHQHLEETTLESTDHHAGEVQLLAGLAVHGHQMRGRRCGVGLGVLSRTGSTMSGIGLSTSDRIVGGGDYPPGADRRRRRAPRRCPGDD
jgi:hypothetical protein